MMSLVLLFIIHCSLWIIHKANKPSSSYFNNIFRELNEEIFDFGEYYRQREFVDVQSRVETKRISHNLCKHDRKYPRKFFVQQFIGAKTLPAKLSLLGASASIQPNLELVVKFLFYAEGNGTTTSSCHRSNKYIDHNEIIHCFSNWEYQFYSPSLRMRITRLEILQISSCTWKQSYQSEVQMWKEILLECSLQIDQSTASLIVENSLELELMDRSIHLLVTFPLCLIPLREQTRLPTLRSPSFKIPLEVFDNDLNTQPVGTQQRNLRRMVACSQPLYNVDSLESLWPGIMAFWIIHHLFIMGMSSFSIYDTDGSAEKYLKDFIRLGLVEYYPRFHLTYDLYHRTVEENRPYCAQTFIENHCLWSYRGLSEWVAFVHAPDLYLFDGTLGGKALYDYLQASNEAFIGLPQQIFDEVFDKETFVRSNDPSISENFFLHYYTSRVENLSYSSYTPLVNPSLVDGIFIDMPALNLYPPHSMEVTHFFPSKHFITLFTNITSYSLQTAPETPPISVNNLLHLTDVEMLHSIPWIRKAYLYLQEIFKRSTSEVIFEEELITKPLSMLPIEESITKQPQSTIELPRKCPKSLVLIGSGHVPYPPKGWGAIEIILHDYYVGLTKLGCRNITILSTTDHDFIRQQVEKLQPEICHIHFDAYVAALTPSFSHNCQRVIITLHGGYLSFPEMWSEGYRNIVFAVAKQGLLYSNIYYFLLSPRHQPVLETIQSQLQLEAGNHSLPVTSSIPFSRFYHLPNGINISQIQFKAIPLIPTATNHFKSICIGTIDNRKGQVLLQQILPKDRIDFVGPLYTHDFIVEENYLGEWTREEVFQQLTHYGNLILFSFAEAVPLVILEAFAAGLGVVISPACTDNLDLSQPFITVISWELLLNYPQTRIEIQTLIENNRQLSLQMRNEIHEYAKNFFDYEQRILPHYLSLVSQLE